MTKRASVLLLSTLLFLGPRGALADTCGMTIAGVPCTLIVECFSDLEAPLRTNNLSVQGCVSSVGHQRSNQVTNIANGTMATDAGGWAYFNDPQDPRYGEIRVNCFHPEKRNLSKPWISN